MPRPQLVPREPPTPDDVSLRPVPDAPPSPLSDAKVALLLVAAALLPRLIAFPFNENLYGDAVVRTELAERWLRNPRWIFSFDDGVFQFGPLHIYLLAGALKLFPDREHAGRLLSLLFGVLTVLPLFSLTRRLFDRRAAVWACLAFSVWGLHLQLSSTAASEALGLFLILSVLALFAQGLDEGRFAPLAASALVLNLACATRYDAWMLVPLLSGLLLVRGSDRVAAVTRAVTFGLFSLPFPFLWMHGNELVRGDPFYPLTYIDQYHARWFADGLGRFGELGYRLQNLFFWPGSALVTLTPLVALFGLAGMVRTFRQQRDHRWLIWTVLLPTAYFTFRSAVLGNFVPLGRFTVVQVALVLPFVVVGFDWVVMRIGTRLARALAVVAGVCAVLIPLGLGAFTYDRAGKWENALRPVSPTSNNDPAVRRVARFIKQQVAPTGGAIILDSDPGYRDLQVAFFSGLPEERMARYRWEIFPERVASADPKVLIHIEGGGGLEQSPDFEQGVGRARLGKHWFEEVPGFLPPFRVYRR
jgi:hypothetical protein